MPDVDLAGVTIHYELAGDAPLSYVYCHGLGASGAGFEQEDMGWYAQRFRTVSWDQRGRRSSPTRTRRCSTTSSGSSSSPASRSPSACSSRC